jgi:hypothetical protein
MVLGLAQWLKPNWKRSLLIVTPESVVRWHVFEVKKEIPIVGSLLQTTRPETMARAPVEARGLPAEPRYGVKEGNVANSNNDIAQILSRLPSNGD